MRVGVRSVCVRGEYGQMVTLTVRGHVRVLLRVGDYLAVGEHVLVLGWVHHALRGRECIVHGEVERRQQGWRRGGE